MKKEKLLLIWPYFPPDPGAASTRGAAFYKYLKDKFEVKVITKDNKKFPIYEDGPNTHRLKISGSIFPHKALISKAKLTKEVKTINPDIIIASSPPLLLALYASIAAEKVNSQFYLDVRDLRLNTRGYKSRVLSKFSKKTYQRARKIFVTTEEQKKMTIQLFGINEENIEIISNGIDLDNFDLDKKEKKSIDITFQGSINPERNPERIKEFVKEVLELRPDTTFQFIGIDPESSYAQTLVKHLQKLEGKDQIEFTDEVSHKEAVRLINKSKVGLVTQADIKELDYQLPVKVYEYMATRNAVAALSPAKSRALWSFMRKYRPGIQSTDPKELAVKVVELLENEEGLKSIADTNYKNINEFDRKKILQRLPEILES